MEYVQPIRDLAKIDEMKRYLHKRSDRDYLLFVAGVNSGLRISDLLSLKVGDVREQTHITLREKKTDKVRRFRINPALKAELDTYIDGKHNEEWLFPSRQGTKAISRVQAYRILNDAAEAVGITEIGTHTLRKTFGYHMYKRYKDVAQLQKIFGHSAPSITLRYIGIDQDEIDEAYDNFSL